MFGFNFRTFVLVVLVVLAGGVVVLGVFQVSTVHTLKELKRADGGEVSVDVLSGDKKPIDQADFASKEMALSLQASLSGLLARVKILEENNAAKSTATAAKVPTAPFKKQVVYLGSASTDKRDWVETNIQTELNSADYPAGIKVVFMAKLSIIGGEAWARLKNKTTGAIINTTEVSHNASDAAWKTAPAFKLHNGKNTYIIELRSTSGETAHLHEARLVVEQ